MNQAKFAPVFCTLGNQYPWSALIFERIQKLLRENPSKIYWGARVSDSLEKVEASVALLARRGITGVPAVLFDARVHVNEFRFQFNTAPFTPPSVQSIELGIRIGQNAVLADNFTDRCALNIIRECTDLEKLMQKLRARPVNAPKLHQPTSRRTTNTEAWPIHLC